MSARPPARTVSRCSAAGTMSKSLSGGQLSRCESMSHDGIASGDSTTCGSPAEVMDMSGLSAAAAARRIETELAMAPPAPPAEPLKISLRMHDSTGKSISVNFDFDLVHDCYEAVAADMARYLSLDSATVPQIARRIEATVAKEQNKAAQAAVMAHAGAIATTLCVAAAQACQQGGCPRRSTDLAAEQHAALIKRHSQRMRGLLAAEQQRQKGVAASAAVSSVGPKGQPGGGGAEEFQQVRFCKFRGMYVPNVIKRSSQAMQS